MKTLFSLTIIAALASLHTNAQTLERHVIASGGSSVTSPIQLDYTIGEIAVAPITVGTLTLTQGFQQPYFIVIPGNNLFPYLVIYPNPTNGDALSRFILAAPARMTISIYNAAGQLISSEAVNYTGGEMQYIIKSGRLTPGTYFIHFDMNNGAARTSKPFIRLDR